MKKLKKIIKEKVNDKKMLKKMEKKNYGLETKVKNLVKVLMLRIAVNQN